MDSGLALFTCSIFTSYMKSGDSWKAVFSKIRHRRSFSAGYRYPFQRWIVESGMFRFNPACRIFFLFSHAMEGKLYKDQVEITVSNELKLFIRSMAASYQFIFAQEHYDLVQRAMMIDLVDKEGVARLASRFGSTPAGDKIELAKEEVYLMYTMMDLVCRSFLCDVGDDYKSMAIQLGQVSEEHYNKVRNTELMIAQTLLRKFAEDFKDDPDFEEITHRISLLDT